METTSMENFNCKINPHIQPARSFPYPAGFRFKPTLQELILCYLLPRLNGGNHPKGVITECEIYGNKEPWKLFDVPDDDYFFVFTKLKKLGEKEKNQKKKQRTVGTGKWDGCTVNKIKDVDGNLIGFKRHLVFTPIEGGDEAFRRSKIEHGHWTMHELSIPHKYDVVLCVISCNKTIWIHDEYRSTDCSKTQKSKKRKLSCEDQHNSRKRKCSPSAPSSSTVLPFSTAGEVIEQQINFRMNEVEQPIVAYPSEKDSPDFTDNSSCLILSEFQPAICGNSLHTELQPFISGSNNAYNCLVEPNLLEKPCGINVENLVSGSTNFASLSSSKVLLPISIVKEVEQPIDPAMDEGHLRFTEALAEFDEQAAALGIPMGDLLLAFLDGCEEGVYGDFRS